MEFGLLEDFLALAEQLNFSRAAAKRNVTQSAMSRRIRALETWLGTALIDRDTHRLALTPAGEAFQDVALDVTRRLLLGREAAREVAAQEALPLRFASTHLLATHYFPTWLDDLEAQLPVGPVRLTADTMTACERLISEGGVQFLLCHRHPAVPDLLAEPAFRGVRLGEDALIPVAAPGAGGQPAHLLGAGGAVPLLAYDVCSGLGRILRAVHGARLPPETVCTFTSHLASLLRIMALSGRGVAFLAQSQVDADLKGGQLVPAGDASWRIPVGVCLFRARARQAAAAERFWTRLRAAYPPADADFAATMRFPHR